MTKLFPFPIQYDAIRKAIVDQVQAVTGLMCIMAEPEQQMADRPALPYFTMKFIQPAIKKGDDASWQFPGTSKWNVGGQRKLMVDFNVYGRSHEEAYNYGALWQSSLETNEVRSVLKASGIAVWLNNTLRDLSALLNTGYEGRCQLEVFFGIASNLYEDQSYIGQVAVGGTITTDQGQNVSITATATSP